LIDDFIRSFRNIFAATRIRWSAFAPVSVNNDSTMVKPAHPLARLAACHKPADVIVRVVLAARKSQSSDRMTFALSNDNRTDGLAERLRRRELMNARINRVVSEPLRLRKFVGDDFLQPRT